MRKSKNIFIITLIVFCLICSACSSSKTKDDGMSNVIVGQTAYSTDDQEKISLESEDIQGENNSSKESSKEDKQENKEQDSLNGSIGISNEGVEKETSTTVNGDDAEITQLAENDFIVTDGSNRIQLDTPFQELKINEEEETLDNNYVGEVYAGDYVYKTYFHNYPDFILYISNTNYNTKGRNFDDYYITQITLLNTNYATARGVTIGTSEDELYLAYGKGEKQENDGKEQVTYTYNDKKLIFELDLSSKVSNIYVTVLSEEKSE